MRFHKGKWLPENERSGRINPDKRKIADILSGTPKFQKAIDEAVDKFPKSENIKDPEHAAAITYVIEHGVEEDKYKNDEEIENLLAHMLSSVLSI